MNNISLNLEYLEKFVSLENILKYKEIAINAKNNLDNGTGAGNDFLGWMDLPVSINEENISEIEKTAEFLNSNLDYVVVVGIGGSYLGAKAIIDLFSNEFKKEKILFAGHNLDEDYLANLLEFLKDKKFGIIVISKSGTTTEPAIAFRLLKELLIKNTGNNYSKYIVAITDEKKGALLTISKNEGFKTFVIPDNIGGRYSVLTPVGLLPLAVAGINIREIINGAKSIRNKYLDCQFEDDEILKYAILRNIFYSEGKKVEILVSYSEKFRFFIEWWKQLFGESEGKDLKGIFPSGAIFSSDLHSMGQYIQEGERIIFETVLSVENNSKSVKINSLDEDLDELNYLTGKNVGFVNNMAKLGTIMAHTFGGVPNILINIPEVNEFYIGQLIYFFEKSCALSSYILGVNPFNQPGVEAYKNNMFKLLEKPGYKK